MDRKKISLGSGLGVFLLGIILLLFTFYIAYSVFTNPETLTGFQVLIPEMSGEAGQVIGPIVEIMSYVVAGILLWVMGSISGRIAKYGITMFKTFKQEPQVSKKEGDQE